MDNDKQTKTEFAKLMAGVGETFDKSITTTLIDIYFKAFDEYSIDQVSNAFGAHMLDPDQGVFFPRPAHIAKQIIGTAKQQDQKVTDAAELAWATIIDEMKRIGSYGTLELEDKQALAVVKGLGGWVGLCRKTTQELIWVKKEFMLTYLAYQRTPLEQLPSRLPGRIELDEHKRKNQNRDGIKKMGDIVKKLSKDK